MNIQEFTGRYTSRNAHHGLTESKSRENVKKFMNIITNNKQLINRDNTNNQENISFAAELKQTR